jgi:hypothetical protein
LITCFIYKITIRELITWKNGFVTGVVRNYPRSRTKTRLAIARADLRGSQLVRNAVNGSRMKKATSSALLNVEEVSMTEMVR